MEPLLCSCLLELLIIFVLIASVPFDTVQQSLAVGARQLPTCIVLANGVANVGRGVLYVGGRAEELGARRVRAVHTVPAIVRIGVKERLTSTYFANTEYSPCSFIWKAHCTSNGIWASYASSRKI